MADIDTSFYPKATSNNLMDSLVQAAQIKNLGAQNRLLNIDVQRQGVGLSQDKINLAHQQYGQLSDFLGSLAQDPRMGTVEGPQILQRATKQAVDQGWITPEIAHIEMQNMPSDPTKIPQYLQNLNTRVLGAQAKFGQIYGSPTMISNGSEAIPATVSPLTGVRQIGAPIRQTLSPSERADLVTTTDAQGRTVIRPKAEILQQAGVNPLTAQPETAPTQPFNRLVPPAEPNAAPGGVIASPPAGQVEAQRNMAIEGSKQYASDLQNEADYQASITPLEKARDALTSLGTTGTGPGKEQINEMKSFLVSNGIIGPNDDVKNFDEARKYLVQFARQAGDTNTNDKLAAAFAGNPSTSISNAAAVDVVKTALALRRLQNAGVRAFDGSPQEYSKYKAQWASTQDPVAYGFDMMSPKERQAYFAGLNPSEKSRFVASLNTATRLGLISPPEVPNGQ